MPPPSKSELPQRAAYRLEETDSARVKRHQVGLFVQGGPHHAVAIRTRMISSGPESSGLAR
jgi:hypothetical protein